MKLNFLYFFFRKTLRRNVWSFLINSQNDILIFLKNNDFFLSLTLYLKKNTILQYSQFVDICVIDYPFLKYRFVLLYNFISILFNQRILCKLFLSNKTSSIISIDSIYIGANWSEREIFDMFGIFFNQNKDLRRILTDYGFDGYPLKKDFPLTGYLELYYDEENLSLKYVPVELAQDFRVFNFLSPWEFNF